MTIVLSISVQDGVVLASDSAVEHRGQVYYSAEKTVQLIKGMPIGVLVSGDAAINNKAFVDVLKDFGALHRNGNAAFDKNNFTVEAVVRRLQDYLRSMEPMQVARLRSTLIIAGYSSYSDTPEVWNLVFDSREGVSATQIWSPREYGICWEGEGECLHRLMSDGFNLEGSDNSSNLPSNPTLVTPGMPLHDAVALTRFLMETTISYVRFRVDLQPKTVGGPVDLAVITRHEGFRWVQRKKLTTSNVPGVG